MVGVPWAGHKGGLCCCCCLSIYGLGGKMKHTPGSRAASTYKQTTQPSPRNAPRFGDTGKRDCCGSGGGLISFKKYINSIIIQL